MVSEEKVQQVRQLLAAGKLSQRAIAKQVGVSREVVAGVAKGTRPDYATRAPRKRGQRRTVEPPRPLDGPYERCDGCKADVIKPCLLCQLNASEAAAADDAQA